MLKLFTFKLFKNYNPKGKIINNDTIWVTFKNTFDNGNSIALWIIHSNLLSHT